MGMRKLIKIFIPIIGPLAAIIVYNVFDNIWAMIAVAWAALILFFVL